MTPAAVVEIRARLALAHRQEGAIEWVDAYGDDVAVLLAECERQAAEIEELRALCDELLGPPITIAELREALGDDA